MRITYTTSKTTVAAKNDAEFALYVEAIRSALQNEFPDAEIEIREGETLDPVHVDPNLDNAIEICERAEDVASRAIERV